MRVASSVVSVSWVPSESVAGITRKGFDVGLAHYDDPPPRTMSGIDDVRRQRDEDRFRFANVLSAWVEVSEGSVVAAGYDRASGLVMGSTTVSIARLEATFQAYRLPTRQAAPELRDGSARFVQTVGGRTGVPLPRPVPHPPFVQWSAPLVWTTLELTIRADGSSDVRLPGASVFPRHWVYGPDGALALKSAVTDQDHWVAHSFGSRTPWGHRESDALVTSAATELEDRLARLIMRGGHRPTVRRVAADETVTRQGEPGDELFLLLDGVLAVEVDGERVAEVGPGAVLGERAILEGGTRTSTLVAVTPARLAVAAYHTIDRDRLRDLAAGHRREVRELAG